MAFNHCAEFTYETPGGSSVCQVIIDLFSNIESAPGTEQDTYVITAFDFVKQDIANSPIKTVDLRLADTHGKHFNYHVIGTEISCFCEFLLFIIVNFEISDNVAPKIFEAVQLYRQDLIGDRYNEELDRLFLHLKDRPNTHSIIRFLHQAYSEYYKLGPTSLTFDLSSLQ